MVLEVVHVLFDWQETVNQLTLIWVNTFGHEPKCTVLKSLEQYLNCIAKQNSSRIVVCITTTWCKWWLAKPSVRATAHKTCKVTEEQVFVTGAHSRMTWWAESNNRIDSKQVTARCHIKATDKWHACKTQTDRPGFSSSQCHLIACQTSKTTAVSQQASKQHSCGHHCVILHPKIKKGCASSGPSSSSTTSGHTWNSVASGVDTSGNCNNKQQKHRQTRGWPTSRSDANPQETDNNKWELGHNRSSPSWGCGKQGQIVHDST